MFGKKKIKLIENVQFKFALGSVAKCKLTSFEGIITARCQWLNACNVYTLQPQKLTKEGKVADSRSFDEPQLDLVSGVQFEPKRLTGGPEKAAPRSH